MMVPRWIGWVTILAFYTSTLIQGQLTASSKQHDDGLCDCGHYDPSLEDQSVWTNVWTADFGNDMDQTSQSTITTSWDQLTKDFFVAKYEIPAKYKGTFGRKFSGDNVNIQDEALHLKVTIDDDSNSISSNTNSTFPAATTALCGAIGTKRQDILYGSFRSVMRLTNTNGTVQSMYIFHPGGEVDIEVVSAVTPPQAYFAIHPGLQEPNGRASALTHDNHHLGFDPWSDFYEYRFDWYPDRAVFYINGKWAQTLTTNIPQVPSRFMFSHWTDGNPKFSQGPPITDASMEIKSIVALFNTSSDDQPTCQQKQSPCALSSVPKRQSSSALPNDLPAITLVSDKIELPKQSDASKNTESYFVVFLFLIGCTVLLA